MFLRNGKCLFRSIVKRGALSRCLSLLCLKSHRLPLGMSPRMVLMTQMTIRWVLKPVHLKMCRRQISRLFCKGDILPHHHLVQCKRNSQIFEVKQSFIKVMMAMSDKDDKNFNIDDDQDLMALASTMEMWDEDEKQKLDDFSTIGEHFNHNAYGGVLKVKHQSNPENLPEMMLMFLNTGCYRLAEKDGTIYDGKVINLTDVPDEKKKGRLTIRSNGITLYYDYTEHDKVQDVYEALDESAIYCNGDNGVFRLKFLSSPSTLLAYQPIFAEFGTNPSFELVATLKGGRQESQRCARSR